MTIAKIAFAGTYAAFVVAFGGGCEPALGLEHATLAHDAAVTGSMAASLDTECAVPPSSKCACTSACANARTDCLAETSCRRALTTYGVCLTGTCTDHDSEMCLEGVATDTSSVAANPLVYCLETCGQTDCKSQVASICESFCSCMRQPSHCAQTYQNTWNGDYASCLTTCSGLGARTQSCRLAHCEFAHSSDVHCDHAIGGGVVGAALDPCAKTTSSPQKVCLGKAELGSPCSKDVPCCDALACKGGFCSY